ncbi:MAG: YbaY family lipoprotein [Opitutales bacterium]|nr:YbaY family lipoprotein [Opitutales bacterium]
MPVSVTRAGWLGVFMAAVVLAGCGQRVDDPSEQLPHVVRGMAIQDVQLRLSTQSRVVAELLDISDGLEDAPVISRQELSPAGQSPLPLELRYRPSEIDGGVQLAVRVTVEDRDEVFFITPEPLPRVDRRQASEIVEVRLEATEAAHAFLEELPEESPEDALPEIPEFESEVPEELMETPPDELDLSPSP